MAAAGARILRRNYLSLLIFASLTVPRQMAENANRLNGLMALRAIASEMIVFVPHLSRIALFPNVAAIRARYFVGSRHDTAAN